MRMQNLRKVIPALIVSVGLVVIAIGSESTAQGQKGTGTSNWKQLRTAWGDPDIQGIWGLGFLITPLERQKRFADREFLTDQEVTQLERENAERLGGDSAGGRVIVRKRGTEEDVGGAYNQAFSRGGAHQKWIRTKRTSLIIDPPDGRVPRINNGDTQQRLAALKADASMEDGPSGSADNPEDRNRNDRCFGLALPFIAGVSSGTRRIVQTPGAVALYHEDGQSGGAFRAIPLTNRPHLPPSFRQYLGDARGRWEGDTLVVDITNFTDQTNFEGSTDNLHLTERYTREGPDLLMLRATIEDPKTFTRPWTIEIPLTKADEKANQIYESSCHEGNYALTSILMGARNLEKEKAQQKPKE